MVSRVGPVGLRAVTVPWTVRVVVPARDEERLLPGCLAALHRAVLRARRDRAASRFSVTVVLDSCVDATPQVLARAAGDGMDVDALAVDHGLVGATRASGVEHAVRDDPDPDRVWLANTDADTLVPEHWLVAQLDLADGGAEVVIGTVEPHRDDLAPDLLAAWHLRHRLVEGHGHVHGANLGLTLAAYRRAGGFPRLGLHEDRTLVERLRALDACCVSTDATRVVTSGRRWGRADGGFADYLSALEPGA